MRTIVSKTQRRVAVALAALTIAGGAGAAVTPQASAAPSAAATQPGIHRVDQLGDVTYQALFAAGVQVYEFVGFYKQTDAYNPPLYYTVLRKLHNPREGKAGSKRYGFLGFGPGTVLPELFGMYPQTHPTTAISFAYTFPFDSRTGKPVPQGRSQCITAPSVGPIGPLTGGGAWVRSVCYG
ncbi:hypothetical protein [Gordonia sp. NPDC003429]